MGRGMRAGKKPSGGGMGNMQKQMQQMQQMQRKMEAMQAEIDQKEVETTAGGGAVTVKINGKKEIVELNLKPEVVDPDDIETLSDILVAAVKRKTYLCIVRPEKWLDYKIAFFALSRIRNRQFQAGG